MAVVSLFTTPACGAITTTVKWDEAERRHRVVSCTCGWVIWTMADDKGDMTVAHVESEVHRQIADEFGWNHPRGRIIAWLP